MCHAKPSDSTYIDKVVMRPFLNNRVNCRRILQASKAHFKMYSTNVAVIQHLFAES